jgi:hypothetical protein
MLAHAVAYIALRHYMRELTRRELTDSSSLSMPLTTAARTGQSIRHSMKVSAGYFARRFTLQSGFEAGQLAVKSSYRSIPDTPPPIRRVPTLRPKPSAIVTVPLNNNSATHYPASLKTVAAAVALLHGHSGRPRKISS